MKALRLVPVCGILWWLCCSTQAQAYRRYNNRRFPPGMVNPYNPALSNHFAQATNPPAPNPMPAPTNRVMVVTQVIVRIVQPPPDPEKVKEAKAELVRRTVEFQKSRAAEGSESAQYELGLRYLKGDGVEKDEATGRKWLTQSAQNGYLPATRKLEELDNPPKPKPKPAKEE